MRVPRRGLVAGVVCVAGAGVVRGQWTVTVLTPPQFQSAEAGTIVGDVVTGYVFSGAAHAAAWRLSDHSFFDLNPPGASTSGVRVCRDGTLVGRARFNGLDHAGMWVGWPPQWADLHPPAAHESWLLDMSGGSRVGMVMPYTTYRAALWVGSPASWTDLTPGGVFSAVLDGVRDGIQIGYIETLGSYEEEHASMWTGTAASWVDLNPPGSDGSAATGITDDHRVIGWAYNHGGYWRGSSESWVDLNPEGATDSAVFAAYGDMLVGEVGFNWNSRAWLWRGSPPVSEDLSLALNGGWEESAATGVWSDGTTLYVVGRAYTVPNGPDDAILWTRPLNSCYANCDASTVAPVLNVNDFLCFMGRFAAGDSWANCDGSTEAPVLNMQDFMCFQGRFAAGCE